jgi:glycosyltransferase involved in cell wall biosynthesis
MRPRVAVVVSHPIQHFCPLYRAVTEDGRLALKVFFGSTAGASAYFDKDFNREVRWQSDLLDGYQHEFLPGAEGVRDLSRPISNPALEARLDAWDPAAVVAYGFFHGLSRAAYRWGRRRGRRTLSIADSELRQPRPLATRLRKRLSVPFFLRQVDAFLTVGDCNEAYYRHYGARPEQFHRSPFPIDERALDQVVRERERHRAAVRQRLGAAPEDCVALMVGKLTARKRPADAIRALAWALGRPGGEGLRLVLAGDGPERPALEALVGEVGRGRVHLAGFVEVGDLAGYYAAADLLVHPSAQDPHPLTISEAIYFGLPCIVSDRVGSVGPTDDVRPGENGLEFPVGSVEALGRCMVALASDPARRADMGRRSAAIGEGRRMAATVEGFVKGVTAAP